MKRRPTGVEEIMQEEVKKIQQEKERIWRQSAGESDEEEFEETPMTPEDEVEEDMVLRNTHMNEIMWQQQSFSTSSSQDQSESRGIKSQERISCKIRSELDSRKLDQMSELLDSQVKLTDSSIEMDYKS